MSELLDDNYKFLIDVQKLAGLKKDIILYQNNINNILNNIVDEIDNLSDYFKDDNYQELLKKRNVIKLMNKNIISNISSFIEDYDNVMEKFGIINN